MSDPKIETRWVKSGIGHNFVFLGKDVIATATGVYVVFFNLTNKEERIECFVGTERGDGACCLAGHPVVPMFSFAERRPNPNIFVYTYPNLTIVSKCKLANGPISYLSCCFAGTEYLLSLASFPNFEIILWQWRTGERLTSINTQVTGDLQKIQSSIHSPLLISHFASNAGLLSVYEIHTCSKIVSLTQTEIKLPGSKIICTCWITNGYLLVCDEHGKVFSMNIDGKKHLVTTLATADTEQKRISLRGFQGGFLSVDGNSKITLYKKMFDEAAIEVWNPIWTIEGKSHPLSFSAFRQIDRVLFNAEDGGVYEILHQDWTPRIGFIRNEGRKVKFMVLVNPEGLYSVVIDYYNRLWILNNIEGNFEDKMYLEESCEEVTAITSHPNSPLIAIITEAGRCIFIAVTKLAKLIICKTFHLTIQPLDGIRFSNNGEVLGVTTPSKGDIFMINTSVTKEMTVIFHKCTEKPIVNFLIYETQPHSYKIVILFTTSSIAKVGNLMAVYKVTVGGGPIRENYHVVYLSNFFDSLYYGPKNICDFIASPYLTKELHFCNLQDDKKTIVLSEVLPSTHQLRKFDIFVTNRYIITSGFDGLVIARQYSNPSKLFAIFMPHHRHQHGTKSSIITPLGNFIVSLGRDGSIVGTSISFESLENLPSMEDFNVDEWMPASFIEPCDNNAPTWLKSLRLAKLEKENELYKDQKVSILEDFQILKDQVKALLDENETRSESSILPIFAFDLNVAAREKKTQQAIMERTEVQKSLENKIQRQDEVSEYIRQKFFDPLIVPDCGLISFSGETRINNFSLRLKDSQITDDFSIILFDIMPPPLFETESLNDSSQMTVSSFSMKTKRDETAESKIIEISEEDDEVLSSGTTSYRWIKDEPDSRKENKQDFVQPIEYRLKVYFNQHFDNMKLFKNDVMQRTAQRLKRLNYCKGELEEMFGSLMGEMITQPTWHTFENPNFIISVDELTEYTGDDKIDTDSLLEGSEYIIEVRRFKKRKLDEVMDGLLEVRWEDVIKWDIPKPEFLIKKCPDDYTPEDQKALEQYKLKVVNLEADRQKYKFQLRREIAYIKDQIKEDINSFNQKMKAMYLEKIKIKCAILQDFSLRLRVDRGKVIKLRGEDHISLLKEVELLPAEIEVQEISKKISVLESTIIELKNRYDSLVKRDKLLEGKFRGEFSDLKLPMVDHLYRHYKKRPKIDRLVCTSVTYLTEMSHCILNGEKSDILPRECLDVLRAVNDVDVMPANLPPLIEAHHWQLLCKLRRNKVDIDIKLKVGALEIAEAEQTLSFYQKLGSSIQVKINTTRTIIETEYTELINNANDPDVQLVLKSAQIEVQSNGHVDDLLNATTVTYTELLRINESIIMTGQQKLAAMNMSINYRKTVLWEEWKHERMKMQMMDLQEDVETLEGATAGKACRSYLMESSEVKSRTKDDDYINRIIQSTLMIYRRKGYEADDQLKKVLSEIRFWNEKNSAIDSQIENAKARHSEVAAARKEESRRLETFRNRLKAIMKRTKMVKIIERNYNELLTLQTHLELLRLKTYPTLKLKT